MASTSTSTHDRIRRAAAQLFARRGYGGTSMADIAERVGVRKASLYNYYASKSDLLLELLERSLEDWEQASRPTLSGEGSCESRLAAYLQAAVEFTERDPQAVSVVRLAATQIGGDLGRRVRSLVESHDRESRQQLLDFFTTAVDGGELAPADPAEIALFWKAFLDGILINQLFATGQAGELRRRLPRMWAFFWRGVGGRSSHTEVSS